MSGWDGPPIWLLLTELIVFGSTCLAISYMAVNGIPSFIKDGLFRRGSKFPVNGRTVLITGASQGMGRGVANLLSHKGANVILVARNSEKLHSAVEYISKAALKPKKQRFHYISADVSKPEENARVIKEATEWNNGQPPDIVWAIAGGAAPALFLDTPVDTFRAQMDLNYFAALYLAKETLSAWLQPSTTNKDNSESSSDDNADVHSHKRRRRQRPPPRHFVMTSSTVAFCGVAGYAPYAPAKAALRSLHDTLRSELQLYNGYLAQPDNRRIPLVEIHTVFPGTILSPGLEHENQTKHPVTSMLEAGDPAQTEHEVAVAAVEGLERGKTMFATQMLGKAMRAGALMGSARDSPIVDTLFGWAMGVAWLFVGPDMERKVARWGRENGMPLAKAD